MRSTSIKTAELKANLSRYLRRVRNGERVVVLDRDTPVAEILPLARTPAEVFARLARDGRCRLGTQKRGKLSFSKLTRKVALEDFVIDELPDADLSRR